MASQNALITRRMTRAKNAQERANEADRIKSEGNDLFKAGDYMGAANYYVHAINMFGPKTMLLSNLAAAYLKLDLYEEALWAATTALEYDPRMIKARFRRAVARKNLFLYKSAIRDLETIVTEDPSCEVAAKELNIVLSMMEADEGVEENEAEREHPRYHDEPWDSYSDSETEDCKHKGNNTPCRFYNHDGCGSANSLMHLTTTVGKNVCLKFLFNNCEFGAAKCIYSHDRTHLPAGGWWNDQAKVEAAKKIHNSGATSHCEYESLHPILLKYPKGHGFAARSLQVAVIDHMNFQYENAVEDVSTVEPEIPPPKGRFVLVLSLEWAEMFTSIHTHLMNGLRQKAEVVHILENPKAHKKALQYLEMPNLAAVFVADPGIVKRKFTVVLRKLVQYVKNGGSAVLGGSFSSHISPPTFDEFMKNTWGLDWKFGDYHRTTFSVNPDNELVKRNPSLALSYSMKTVHVANIQPEMAIYTPTENARLQSLVFAPVRITDTSESPAVCTRVGRGLLSFLGDVNAEVGSTSTILAMLGLLDEPNEPLPPPPAPATSPASQNAPSAQDGSDVAGASTPTSQPLTKKFVLVLCMERNMGMFKGIHASQISALNERAEIKFADNAPQALVHLASPDICGVYIADDWIIKPSNSHVLAKILEYVKSGGLALLGGLFPTMTNKPDLARTFASFGLPWKPGSYYRSEAQLNRHHQTAAQNPTLCDAFDMKAVFLTGFHPEDLLYEQHPPSSAKWESPVLRIHLGKGQLGYIGDVNAESESTPIVLAMFDLLTPPKALVPDSQKFLIILTPYSEAYMKEFVPEFIKDVKQKAEIILGLSNARVIDLLPSKDLVGVLVADSYILGPKNAYLLSKLVEYSKDGGTLVFGWLFAHQVTATQFRPLFRDNWNLDWDLVGTNGSNVARTSKNSLLRLVDDPEKLPKAFYLDGVFVKGIAQSMAVYSAQNRTDLWKPKDHIIRSAVVYTDTEKGHLGFIGVDNLDNEIRDIFYAMVGLL